MYRCNRCNCKFLHNADFHGFYGISRATIIFEHCIGILYDDMKDDVETNNNEKDSICKRK